MRKSEALPTVILFILACTVPHLYRVLPTEPVVRHSLFPYSNEVISWPWYSKFLCDKISFFLLMLLIYKVLQPVKNHIQKQQWIGHNRLLIFVQLWVRVFSMIAISAFLDILHFALAFQKWEWYFLAQNILFTVITSYYIYKAFKPK
jgi:hypothetical protein